MLKNHCPPKCVQRDTTTKNIYCLTVLVYVVKFILVFCQLLPNSSLKKKIIETL